MHMHVSPQYYFSALKLTGGKPVGVCQRKVKAPGHHHPFQQSPAFWNSVLNNFVIGCTCTSSLRDKVHSTNWPAKMTVTASQSPVKDQHGQHPSGGKGHEAADAAKHMADVERGVACLPPRTVRMNAVLLPDDQEPPAGGLCLLVVRHGQGHHNVFGAEWAKAGKPGDPYVHPDCPYDPTLTELGHTQAQAVATRAKALHPKLQPSLVVTSPMRRATQTAVEGFGYLLNLSPATVGSATGGVVMAGTASVANDTTCHIPFVAHELAHEQAGLHRCDKRLLRSELVAQFPGVDYSLIASEEDPFWGDGSSRETGEAVVLRAYQLMQWLQSRPEKSIALVSHSGLLLALCSGILECRPKEIGHWLATGEMRVLHVSFEDIEKS
eukprot:jgi/Mesvir1/27293/Mv07126-RA.1